MQTVTIPSRRFDYALIAWRFLDDNGRMFRGGAELHLSAIARVLREQGHRVVVIQHGPRLQWDSVDEAFSILSLPGKHFAYYYRAQRWAVRLAAHVHFNYFEHAFPYWLPTKTIVSATHHGTPWDVPSSRNIPEDYVAAPFRSALIRGAAKWTAIAAQQYVLGRNISTLAVDTSVLRYAREFAPKAVPCIAYIPNFVDTEVFCPDGELPAGVDKNTSTTAIFYPRNFSVARGISFLPEVAHYLRSRGINVHFYIAGRPASKSPTESAFIRDAQRLGIADAFSFLGSLDQGDMAQWYRAADIVLVPTLYAEGTSLSCLEAMASGTPVVVTEVGGLLDLVHHRYNGFLAFPSAPSISRTLEEAIVNRDRSYEYAVRARDMVLARHTFKQWSASVAQFFASK